MPKPKHKSQQPEEDEAWVSDEEALTPFPPAGDHDLADVWLSLMHAAQPPRTGNKALDALLISGRAGKPAPRWAVLEVEQIIEQRVTGKVRSLDIALGYSTGSAKDSPVKQRLKKNVMQHFFLDVWRLTLLGYTKEKACEKVAGRILKEEGWNTTAYRLPLDRQSIKPRKFTDPIEVRDQIGDTLNRDYYKWKKSMSALLESREALARTWLISNREIFLKQFPADDT